MSEQLNRILEQVCMEEYSCHEEYPVHHFSLRHRRNMRRLFAARYSVPSTERRPRLCRRTVAILVAAIFLALVAVSGAAYFIGSFVMREHNDNTQLTAAGIAESPETIEQLYYISALPEGYSVVDSYSDECESVVKYQLGDDVNNTITFTQLVRSEFDNHLNTESYQFESVTISGYDGLLIDWSSEDYTCCEIVWDNGEYIFTLVGNLNKTDITKLAESTKIQ